MSNNIAFAATHHDNVHKGHAVYVTPKGRGEYEITIHATKVNETSDSIAGVFRSFVSNTAFYTVNEPGKWDAHKVARTYVVRKG